MDKYETGVHNVGERALRKRQKGIPNPCSLYMFPVYPFVVPFTNPPQWHWLPSTRYDTALSTLGVFFGINVTNQPTNHCRYNLRECIADFLKLFCVDRPLSGQ